MDSAGLRLGESVRSSPAGKQPVQLGIRGLTSVNTLAARSSVGESTTRLRQVVANRRGRVPQGLPISALVCPPTTCMTSAMRRSSGSRPTPIELTQALLFDELALGRLSPPRLAAAAATLQVRARAA